MDVRRIVIVAAMPSILGGCVDFLVGSSAYNLSDRQVSEFTKVDLTERDDLKVDMPAYIGAQLAAIENRLKSRGLQPKEDSIPEACESSDGGVSAALGAQPRFGPALAGDPVIRSIMVTSMIRGPGIASPPTAKLGYAEFQNFRRRFVDAGLLGGSLPAFRGSARAGPGGGESMTGALLAPSPRLTAAANAKDSPLLAYAGAYYRGAFVDRFGKGLMKPSFENGVDDGTIANFVRVLTEAAIDSSPRRIPVYKSKGGAWLPNNKASTFYNVFREEARVAADGKTGISEKEVKVVEFGANLIADQGMTLFGGLLEFLSSIHVGFIVAGNFAVGSNDTLKAIARSVIETALRRGAEHNLYCLAARYDLDLVGDIIAVGEGAGS